MENRHVEDDGPQKIPLEALIIWLDDKRKELEKQVKGLTKENKALKIEVDTLKEEVSRKDSTIGKLNRQITEEARSLRKNRMIEELKTKNTKLAKEICHLRKSISELICKLNKYTNNGQIS